jgi:plastocyanin
LVAGFGALFLGVALVWWADKGTSGFTGPFLGVAIAVTMLAGFGWAYQDGVMKRKAEAGSHGEDHPTRFTQVVTFALAEGQMAAAQAGGGVLHAIESADNALHDLAGFQDLRIIASPAAVGPAQVLVETTWSNREGLASYDETRRTILDIVNAHSGQVVAGSVQVFDMQVVRDTKDVSVRFGMGAATALFGSLIVGGFMVGAGLNLFEGEQTKAEGASPADGGGPVADPGAIRATDNKFSKATLEAPPNTDVTFTLTNGGRTKHNLSFYDKQGGKAFAQGKFIDGGASDQVSFKTPAAGNYFFQCDLHPTEMTGALIVKDGAPIPGAAAAAAPAAGAK